MRIGAGTWSGRADGVAPRRLSFVPESDKSSAGGPVTARVSLSDSRRLSHVRLLMGASLSAPCSARDACRARGMVLAQRQRIAIARALVRLLFALPLLLCCCCFGDW